MTDKDLGEMARKLSRAQIWELRHVRNDDQGFLARGDPSNLTAAGMATAPMGQGYYRLTPLGLALRSHLQGETL